MSEELRSSPDKKIENVLAKIMTPAEYARTGHDSPYIFNLEGHGKRIDYIGAAHSNNPDDPLFSTIENTFRDSNPDLAVVEGVTRLGEYRGRIESNLRNLDRDEVIRRYSEPLFTLKLAFEKGIDVSCPEPESEKQHEFLLDAGFTKENIFAHRVVELSPQYHRQPYKVGFSNYVAPYISRFISETQWPDFDYSLAHAVSIIGVVKAGPVDLDRENLKYLDDPIPWPSRKSSWTALNEVSQAQTRFRDETIVTSIANNLKTHNRLFIVYGGSHAVMQEPALQELIK